MACKSKDQWSVIYLAICSGGDRLVTKGKFIIIMGDIDYVKLMYSRIFSRENLNKAIHSNVDNF